jgi:hypothetical protein
MSGIIEPPQGEKVRIVTRGARGIGSATLGLVLTGAALFLPAAAASAQDGQPDSGSDARLVLYAGLVVLAVGTVLVVAIGRRRTVRRSRNRARSRVSKPDALAPTPNGSTFVPGKPDLSLSDLALPERRPQSASNGSGTAREPLIVEVESEPVSEASGASTMWLERSEPDAQPSSTFDAKMQEFLRELRSYHK